MPRPPDGRRALSDPGRGPGPGTGCIVVMSLSIFSRLRSESFRPGRAHQLSADAPASGPAAAARPRPRVPRRRRPGRPGGHGGSRSRAQAGRDPGARTQPQAAASATVRPWHMTYTDSEAGPGFTSSSSSHWQFYGYSAGVASESVFKLRAPAASPPAARAAGPTALEAWVTGKLKLPVSCRGRRGCRAATGTGNLTSESSLS
jgi:hypothetical protein